MEAMDVRRVTQDQPVVPPASGPSGATCVRVRPESVDYTGRQGLEVFEGIAAQTAGSRALCLHILRLPPGGRARPHLHERHETAVYILSGQVAHYYGDALQERFLLQAGDFVYIPAGVPHAPVNLSPDEPAVAIVARTDPNEQESVVLRPDLEGTLAARLTAES